MKENFLNIFQYDMLGSPNCYKDVDGDWIESGGNNDERKLQAKTTELDVDVYLPTSEDEFKQMDEIVGILYKNKSDEADEGSWINSSDFHKVASAIFEHFKLKASSLKREGEELFNKMDAFCKDRFPDATATDHLRKLKNEVDEAIAVPTDSEEWGDLQLCLFGAASKQGYSYSDLMRFAAEKFEKVLSRKWVKQSDGTYQHLREGE
jgi:hypothetical protein